MADPRFASAPTLELATPSDTQVVATRTFRAPRALVFATMTEARHLPNWMTGPEGWTMDICEIDLRPGGRFRWRWTNADGGALEMRGEYRDVTSPSRVVNTERWIMGTEWPETINALELTESSGVTRMTLTITYASKELRDGALESAHGPGHGDELPAPRHGPRVRGTSERRTRAGMTGGLACPARRMVWSGPSSCARGLPPFQAMHRHPPSSTPSSPRPAAGAPTYSAGSVRSSTRPCRMSSKP